MALTPAQIEEARNWINSQFGGTRDASGTYQAGPGWNFNGDFSFNPNSLNDKQMANQVFGAAQGMGYGADDIATILGGGITAGGVQDVRNTINPTILDMNEQLFQRDVSTGVFNPENFSSNGLPSASIDPSAMPAGGLSFNQNMGPSISGGGGITNDQINQWLASNPGATDSQIRSAMNQYGVGVDQMSRATGMDYGTVMGRYQAAGPANPSQYDPGIPGVRPDGSMPRQAAGGDVWAGTDLPGGPSPGANQLDWGGGLTSLPSAPQPNTSQADLLAASSGSPNFGAGGGSFQATGPGLGSAGLGNGNFSYGANPYLGQMADWMTQRGNNMLGQQFNMNRSNSAGVGGLGGSRQGVAEGAAMQGMNDSLMGQMANLGFGDYNNAMNRNLQRYGMDQNYSLGLGGLGNQRYGMDQNFYTSQRGQDLESLRTGASLYGLGMQGPWQGMNDFGNLLNGASSQNYTGSASSTSGGGAMGLLGGALTGASLGKQFGWWGS